MREPIAVGKAQVEAGSFGTEPEVGSSGVFGEKPPAFRECVRELIQYYVKLRDFMKKKMTMNYEQKRVKVCENCGKSFESFSGTAKSCSQSCAKQRKSNLQRIKRARISRRKEVQLTCIVCKKTYTAEVTENSRSIRKYCSRKCSNKANNNRRLRGRTYEEIMQSIMPMKKTEIKSDVSQSEFRVEIEEFFARGGRIQKFKAQEAAPWRIQFIPEFEEDEVQGLLD